MTTFKIQPVPSELNLTINHRLLARQDATHIKTVSGDNAARMFFEVEASYKAIANTLNKLKGDLTRSDTEKAYIISDRSTKWMHESTPKVDRCLIDLTGRIAACETKLASSIKETGTTEAIIGAERRTFLRTADAGKRASLAETDPDFAAAIAAAPAVMSGVPDFTHERCVSMTQQRKEPVTFGELADYTEMRDTLNDMGRSMLSVAREMLAPGITATRVDASDPDGMGTPQVG